MDHNQLRSFVAVAQTLNFTRAAKQENLTQPAVSHHINDMERQLGVKLFSRNSHGVALTTAGSEYYKYAVAMLDLAQRAQTRVHDIAQGVTGEVRISTVPSAPHTLTRCLSAFNQRYPNIQVDMEITTGRQQIAAINQNTCDFYFSFSSLFEPHRTLETRPTEPDRFSLVLPRRLRGQVDPGDFTTLRKLAMVSEQRAEGPFLVDRIMDICRTRGLEPERICSYSTHTAVMFAVNSGMGFTVLPSALVETSYVESVDIFPVPGDDAVVSNAIGWNRMLKNSAAEKFLEVLNDLYPQG